MTGILITSYACMNETRKLVTWRVCFEPLLRLIISIKSLEQVFHSSLLYSSNSHLLAMHTCFVYIYIYINNDQFKSRDVKSIVSTMVCLRGV